jgi:hypothetical protein
VATKHRRNQASAKVAAAAPVAMTWEWAADFNRQQIAAGSDGACAPLAVAVAVAVQMVNAEDVLTVTSPRFLHS